MLLHKTLVGSLILSLLALGAILPPAMATNEFDGDDHHGENDHEVHATVIILFCFFGLLLGTIISQLLSIYGEAVPYTVVVFLVGAMFALCDDDDALGQSVHLWAHIDADLMLFIFLPPLIFGEAMGLNWYHIKGGISQALVLAGPGVLVGATLMGCFAKIILPHWSWNLAMLFGSILAATDPVAVVSLLKSANASPKLTILIVGESLLNDGTSMVLFTLFLTMINGDTYTGGEIIAFFLKETVGSVLFGIAVGLATVAWLKTATRPFKEADVTTQISITICCSYLTFFTAQHMLHMSGVLACCGAGAMLAWQAPPVILDHHALHNVWGMIEWGMNTLIFLLAGLIIGGRSLHAISPIDFLWLFVFYGLLIVLRCFVIGLCFPVISRVGHKCTVQDAAFMSYAGLRGALGMALALIAEKDGPDDLRKETSRLVFFVGGIATLTLLINATTAKKVLVMLGLLKAESEEKAIWLNHVASKVNAKMDVVVEELMHEFELNEKDMQAMRLSYARDTRGNKAVDEEMIERRSLSAHNPMAQMESGTQEDEDNDVLPRESLIQQKAREGGHKMARARSQRESKPEEFSIELYTAMKSIYLEIVKQSYWRSIEEGKLPRASHSAQFLMYSIDVGLDRVSEVYELPIDWIILSDKMKSDGPLLKSLHWMEARGVPFAAERVGVLMAKRENREVHMLTSFIEAHNHAQTVLRSCIEQSENEGSGNSASNSKESPEERRVIGESKKAVVLAQQKLKEMDHGTLVGIRRKQAARVLLTKEGDIIRGLLSEGMLTVAQAEEMLESVTEDALRAEKDRRKLKSEKEKEHAAVRKAQARASVFSGGGSRPTSTRVSTASVDNSATDAPSKMVPFDGVEEGDEK